MRRRLALALALGALAAPGAATAITPVGTDTYEGTTSQQLGMVFRVDTPSYRRITRFAIRYRSNCTNGETLRSTFRFAPVRLSGVRFRRTGTVQGMLTDGRAYASAVRLAGKLDGDEASGTFALTTRIPDGQGGVARCTTGALSWTAAANAAR